MALGDTNYRWVNSGSTITSSNAAHNLFGAYGGLSLLNASDVVHVQLHASKNDIYLLPTDEASANQLGQKFVADLDFYQDLPPMKVSNASQLTMRNYASGNDAECAWVVWLRYSL